MLLKKLSVLCSDNNDRSEFDMCSCHASFITQLLNNDDDDPKNRRKPRACKKREQRKKIQIESKVLLRNLGLVGNALKRNFEAV